MLISAPYWFEFSGAVSSAISITGSWCYHEPSFINPKPTWVNVPQGGTTQVIAYVKSRQIVAPTALTSANVYTASPYFSVSVVELAGVLTTSAAVIPNITKITMNVTASSSAPTGHQAQINLTVAGNATEVCGNQTISFTGNVTPNVTALPTPPAPVPPAAPGGSTCTSEVIICGPCQEGYMTCIIDRCGVTTSRVQSCPMPREIPCTSDEDCSAGQICVNNQCVDAPQEIEELPVEIPFIIYPPTWLEFFNPDVVDYPTPGIIEAVRQNLLVLPSKIDLSLFNLYYAPQETSLVFLLKDKPVWKKLTYAFLITLLLLSVVLVVLKAVKTRKEEPVEYGLKYNPPNQ